MRWNNVRPKTDEPRFVTKFLWLPKKINHETRWLEKATYEQVYRGAIHGWYDLRVANK